MNKSILLSVIILGSALTLVNAQPVLDWAYGFGPLVNDEGNEIGSAIRADALGNSYSTGYFTGTVDFDPGPGVANITSQGFDDIFILKYDADGNFVWGHGIGGSSLDEGASLCLDASGNILSTGIFGSVVDFDPGPGIDTLNAGFVFGSAYFTKYDANGNYKWTKSIIEATPYAIATDLSGNVFLTGLFYSNTDFDPGAGSSILSPPSSAGQVFLAKYDSNGNYIWAIQLGDDDPDSGFSLATDDEGNVYVTGFFMGTADFDPGPSSALLTTVAAGDQNVFVASYDQNGNYRWAYGFGGTVADNGNYGFGIYHDPNGSILVTGDFCGSADFDPGPGTAILTSVGEDDVFISKYTLEGTLIWAKALTCTDDVFSPSVTTDLDGNVYSTGNFMGTVDFDPGTDTLNITAVGGPDIYLAKLDASGNFLWAQSFGSDEWEGGNSVATDAANNIYFTGYFNDTIDFDPGPDTLDLVAEFTHYDLFIAKYSQADSGGTVCQEPSGLVTTKVSAEAAKLEWDETPGAIKYQVRYKVAGTNDWNRLASAMNSKKLLDLEPSTTYAWQVKSVCELQPIVSSEWSEKAFFTTDPLRLNDELHSDRIFHIYPNPATDIVRIDPGNISVEDLRIINILGDELYQHKSEFAEMSINISGFPAGIYLIQLKSGDETFSEKFVKE